MSFIDETIDAFRNGTLGFDCPSMVLAQRQAGGKRYEGPGFIRQDDNGILTFKIYVATTNVDYVTSINSMMNVQVGKVYTEDAYFNLEAIGQDGTRWSADRIDPDTSWATDTSVITFGRIMSLTAHLDLPKPRNVLHLHFYEEYDVPRTAWTEVKDGEHTTTYRDRSEFAACGMKFEVNCRKGSGDTIVKVISETPFPDGFDLRIQEALQYLTAKPAYWRAKLQDTVGERLLELKSPSRKSVRTQFDPPISPSREGFQDSGWHLFQTYLAYVTKHTEGRCWNPVAYHLGNACEASANSIDAWGLGLSVAVEALASMIRFEGDATEKELLNRFLECAHTWLKTLPGEDGCADLTNVAGRAKNQLDAMKSKRAVDTLYALAESGHVDESYVKAWKKLRDRQAHPKPKELLQPDPGEMQRRLDEILKVEVLLRQLTFHLIGYEGPYTDYGEHGRPIRQYPPASNSILG